MGRLDNESVHLVITSPPYWNLKDYGVADQIGYGQAYDDYKADLTKVWRECHRLLIKGGRICIVVGDITLGKKSHGRFRIVPLHSDIISICQQVGFDYLGMIVWHKITNCQSSGGGKVMGSYPFPRAGIVKQDNEFILIFKKPGRLPPVTALLKESSRLSKREWQEHFTSLWHLPGVRQIGHSAQFPVELARRLARMFSLKGDTILDPFLGSGTTTQAAIETGRNSVGWEINSNYRTIIKGKIARALTENSNITISYLNTQGGRMQ